MLTLDQRIDALIGPEEGMECVPHVFLELTEDTAHVVVSGLRWALYGGAPPPNGRRALLAVLDSIQQALCTDQCTEESRDSDAGVPQGHGKTITP